VVAKLLMMQLQLADVVEAVARARPVRAAPANSCQLALNSGSVEGESY
jgi:hypothetical protein